MNGISVFGLLGVLFIGLKLANVIMWSWWWVTAPLWGGFILSFLVAFIFIIIKLWAQLKSDYQSLQNLPH